MPLPSAYDAKLWLVLLREIELRGGSARPQQVYPSLRPYFPGMTDEDEARQLTSGGSSWTNRIQWARQRLVERGCVDGSAPGVWRVTPLGREWLNANWRGADADYSSVVKPGASPRTDEKARAARPAQTRADCATTGESRPRTEQAETRAEAATAETPVDPAETLCQRLLRSQLQSSAPEQYEKDLAEAFQALGFDARHVGGSGETDIYVEAHLGQSSYSVVVDAKSTQSGKVPDAQINWSVIDAHRQARGATFAAVIGPGFGGGQLLKFASQYNVVLLKTDMVSELVRLHAMAPFSLFELRDLFRSPGIADDAVKCLRERHAQHRRHWELAARIVQMMERLTKRAPNGLKADNLYYYLLAVSGSAPIADAPTQQDVGDAIAFLASRAVGVLGEVQGSGGAYQLTMSARTARERLSALARAFEHGDPDQFGPTAAYASVGPSTSAI